MSNIPPDIREVFDKLQIEITWLHARWQLYRQLFGHSERQIELLNEAAGAAFYLINDVLIDEVQVSLSKLTDPASSRGFDNLSLCQLQERMEAQGQSQLATDLRVLLDDLQNRCEAFRVRRNKRLAHLDLAVALGTATTPLPGVSRQMIEDALAVVRSYMNSIQGHYDDSEFAYTHFISHGDGEALVHYLKAGLRYE